MFVKAKNKIEQNPLSNDPNIPKGTIGYIEDEADNLLWVDFGEPFGVVATEYKEVEIT